MFLFISEADFAEDNSLSAKNKALSVVVKILQRNTAETLEWFNFNSMAANPAKFQVMFLGIKDSRNLEFRIGNNIVKPTNFIKLFVQLHLKKWKHYFVFDPFSISIVQNALRTPYCLHFALIWMFCSKHSNNMTI